MGAGMSAVTAIGAVAGVPAAGGLLVATGGLAALGGLTLAAARVYRQAARLDEVPREPKLEAEGRQAISKPLAWLMKGM